MNEKELDRYVSYKARVYEQVITWLLLDIARFHFKDYAQYEKKIESVFANTPAKDSSGNLSHKSYSAAGNYALSEICTWFHIDSWLTDLICGKPNVDGKYKKTAEIIRERVIENASLIHYVGKKDVTYKSGKTFSHLSYWFIDTRWAKGLFNNSKYIDHKSSDWYCEEAEYIISKIAFHYATWKAKTLKKTFDKLKKIAEDKNMTKEEKAKLKEECEKGMHAIPYKELVKHIEKKEKTKLRTMQTRIRKMTQKAMAEIVIENEKLKNENSILKQHVEELEAELKQYAEAEVPEDEAYSIDEQDQALVAACEAVDGTKPDAGQCNAALRMIAGLGTLKAQEPKKPTPAEIAREQSNEEAHQRAVNAKNRLQKLVNDEVMDANDAKLIGRVMYGRDFNVKEGPRGWSIITAEKKVNERFKIFDALVMRIKRQEYFNAKKEDIERVMRLSNVYASMVKAIEARRRQEAVQQSIARAQVKQAQAQTPPPIAVPKPQPPVVTDENAGAVLEELGL